MPREKKKKRKSTAKRESLDGLKEEVARDLGLDDDIARLGWANLTSRETGKIGGHMSQKLKRKNRGNSKD